MRIRLPEPPSMNTYWRSVVVKGRVQLRLSAAGRAYKQDVLALWLQRAPADRRPLVGPLAVHLAWHRSRRDGDTDNRIKAPLDALNGLAWVDDDQIVDLRITRHESPRNGYLEVVVWPVEGDLLA